MEQEYKQAKKHLSKLGLRFLIGTFIIYGVQFGAMGIAGLVNPALLENTTANLLITMLPMYIIAMPILYFMLKGLPAVEPEKHKLGAGKFVLAAIICYAMMYCGNLVGTIITMIIGLIKGGQVNNGLAAIVMDTSMPVTFLIMVICAPIVEELIFRKVLIDRTVRYGQGVAVLLSGLMFGLFHGNLNQFVYAFLLGIAFAYLYVKTGNVKITIGLHMIINFIGSILGMVILNQLDAEKLTKIEELVLGGASEAELMNSIMPILPGLMIYLFYLMAILIIVLIGIILFIVFACKKKFTFEKGEIQIEKGKRFKTVICNPGIMAYCVFWIVMIVIQLLM